MFLGSLKDLLKGDMARIIWNSLLFLITIFVVYHVYDRTLKVLKIRVSKSKNKADDFIIDLLRVPVLWLLFWIIFRIFTSYSFLVKTTLYKTISDINDVLLIITTGWILIKLVRILFFYFEHRLDTDKEDNLDARKNLTKLKIFEGIVVSIITVIIIAACLMTFDKVRTIGVSLLTSAGIAGIIIGFAAQKSIAAVLAGIQIAITQPIRLDDVVIVEGNWGRIEEITLTYVVVKIWDERRLVVPVNYFMDNAFENWTRSTSMILGTIFLYVDYKIPLEPLRVKLAEFLDNHPKWDKRVANIQVTDAKENCMELRILLSSRNSGFNWDLRVDIREKMIDFINKEYPDCFTKVRLKNEQQ